MKKFILSFLICCISLGTAKAQEETYQEEELEINKFTTGTLTIPTNAEAKSIVIFIQGSGPTDRHGNQPMMKNDGIKKMARELADNGIASYRFDKRIFKMNELKLKEKDLRFDDFVNDVKAILKYFNTTDEFDNIIIAGHSQGSLLGMLAADATTNAFISLAGVSKPIDSIIVEQVTKQVPELGKNARTAFDEMREKGKTSNYSPMLESIFKPNIQPYMLSWMKYDPSEEIQKLEIPVLILNGTSDIQVEPDEAEKLDSAAKNSQLVLLENMNHIFRKVDSEDRLVNTKSYNEPNLPLHPELIPTITDFIKELE
ncbi:alpha/beta hydrolase family protein [Christiangramia salexigens]|uniref:Alpha/beta hydrolase n=1 Tax=Christiangramia salexigens TaxID=1913577 RepID=A0A1L3J4L2_9FLAO|nr:alpha/beta hydrolase [Christiangramia salexigens]APG60044.1 alpha/beta hydrolase [Christiangramia salexigens]